MSRWYKQLFQKSKAGAEAVLGISLTPDQAGPVVEKLDSVLLQAAERLHDEWGHSVAAL